jgi:hypothetical protein
MASRRKASRRARRGARKESWWSADVAGPGEERDLEPGTFRAAPREVAKGLARYAAKRVARDGEGERSEYRTAMSALTFYVNRAGKNLAREDRGRLEQAKSELRKLYRREA